MDVADGLANIEYNVLIFLFFFLNILLGADITLIFLNRFLGNVVSDIDVV